MLIEKIISLASAPVRLRLLAMIRSLRATGCDLPVWVIPYSDEPESRFALPPGCEWWEQPEVLDWVREIKAHPMVRKYQCFLEGNYQYVDSDIVFLRDPREVLAPCEGFVASCGHWRDPNHTMTAHSEDVFRQSSTNWQAQVFNAGQFACDRPLFANLAALRAVAESSEHKDSCFYPVSEQPGVNLLRLLSGVPLSNLTLPPASMESTWAGDYEGAGYASYWRAASAGGTQREPYLIHWAGVPMEIERPINELFHRWLTPDERAEWDTQVRQRAKASGGWEARARRWKIRLRNAFQEVRK